MLLAAKYPGMANESEHPKHAQNLLIGPRRQTWRLIEELSAQLNLVQDFFAEPR